MSLFKKKNTAKNINKSETEACKTSPTIKSVAKIEIISRTSNNVTINVKIDYKNKTISVLDESLEYAKNFTFRDRTVEYVQGWSNILNAINEAVTFAKSKLDARIQEERAEFEENLMKRKEALKSQIGMLSGILEL